MTSCTTPNLEELHAELLYLVTRYTCEPQGTLADAVTHQLQRILTHPLIDIFPQLRRQCSYSLAIWRKRSGFQSIPHQAQTAALH